MIGEGDLMNFNLKVECNRCNGENMSYLYDEEYGLKFLCKDCHKSFFLEETNYLISEDDIHE